MKKLKLVTFFLLSFSNLLSSAETDYERYKENYCKNGIRNIESVIISCHNFDPTPKVVAEDEISEILEFTVKQDFKKFCRDTDNFKEKIKGYVGKNDIIPFPPNKCACELPRSKKARAEFCSTDQQQKKENLDLQYKSYIMLSKLDKLKSFESELCEAPIEEVSLASCKTNKAKQTLNYIEKNFELPPVLKAKFNQLINNTSITSCQSEGLTNFCTEMSQSADTFSKTKTITDYIGKFDFKNDSSLEIRNLEIYSCLNYNDTREIKTTSNKMVDILYRTNQTVVITEPPSEPAQVKEMEEKYNIKIEEDDTSFIINRKIAIANHKKQYEIDLKRTTEISGALNNLVDQLGKTTDPSKRKQIFTQIHNYKKELRTLSNTVPQKSNIAAIQDIEKKYPEEVKRYYAETEATNNNWTRATDVKQDNFKIPTSKLSNIDHSKMKKEYIPFYNKETNAKRTNIVPALPKTTEEIQGEQENRKMAKKNNIAQTFSSGATSIASRSPASARERSSTSVSAPSLKSYNIPNKEKEPEVLQNTERPRIKVVFIDDQKVMKLFKLQDKVYELQEEINKEDFIENFDNFPELVKEQGRSFFNIFDSKNLRIQ